MGFPSARGADGLTLTQTFLEENGEVSSAFVRAEGFTWALPRVEGDKATRRITVQKIADAICCLLIVGID